MVLGALFAIVVTLWGAEMVVARDFAFAPAWLGLVLMGVGAMMTFGVYYRLVPIATGRRAATAHFWLAVATSLAVSPAIMLAISGGSPVPMFGVTGLAVLSMVVFAVTVWMNRPDLTNYPLVLAPAVERQVEGPHGHKLTPSAFNTRWFGELGVRPSVIFDVGAYDGGDAWRFRLDFPEAQIVSVEADPDRARLVREALAGQDIEVVEAAVADRDGEIGWYPATINGTVDAQGSIYRQTDAMNARFPQVRQATRATVVKSRRLDTLASQFGLQTIDLLHLDIQGAEYVALQGLGHMRPRIIYLEITKNGWVGSGTKDMIHDWLIGRSYRLAANFGSDRLYVL